MVAPVLRRNRRRNAGRLAAAAAGYARLGWPVCLGAYPPSQNAGRACSCDRVGCPDPGAHPISPAWQAQATVDPGLVTQWWMAQPEGNIILVTGRVFDVLDVPAAAGAAALALMERSAARPGPVAVSAGNRALFFVATRGAPADEDEWWSCHLDCEPEMNSEVVGLRWHCRDSYVVAPAHSGRGPGAHWIRDPREHTLPDCLRLLEYLADACEEVLS